MKKLISLSLMLSLGLATISPAIQAAQVQTMRQRASAAMPAWTRGPGFQAAKKWWQAGRNMNALSPQEQRAFNALKKKAGITAIIAILTAILGAFVISSRKDPITMGEGKARIAKDFFMSSKNLPYGDRLALTYQYYGKTGELTPDQILKYSREIARLMPVIRGQTHFGDFIFDILDLLTPLEVVQAIQYGKSLGMSDANISMAFTTYFTAKKHPESPSGLGVNTMQEAIDRYSNLREL